MARIGNGVWELTTQELTELDVGSWFSREFAAERILTLEQAIEAARGRIKLNIELKFHDHNRQLLAEVMRIVEQAAFEQQCVITSLNFAALKEIAEKKPCLRRGLIVTAAIGDVTRLDVDLLAVKAQLVTRDFVARAHDSGKEVHVWTVNDPQQMLTMIHVGVDGILTSSPDVLVELLQEMERMSDAERTLLFVTDILAGRL